MHCIVVPTHIRLAKSTSGKVYSLNMNTYRNNYFHLNNSLKRKVEAIIVPQVEGIPSMDKVSLTYTLFTKTKRRSDLMNWISIIDKYVQDVLVEHQVIKDDNYFYVPQVTCRYGGIANESFVVLEITEESESLWSLKSLKKRYSDFLPSISEKLTNALSK